MRWAAWCLVGLVVACGKSHTDGEGAPEGEGASAGAGSTSAPEGGSAASTMSNGGSAGSTTMPQGGNGSGGAPTGVDGGSTSSGGSPNAGTTSAGSPSVAGTSSGGTDNAGAAGGQAAGSGGALATAGSDNAGAAGAPENDCGGAYVACGCGCCSETDVTHACYYPDLGDTRAGVVARDEAQATDESCANAGCALGTEYACCVVPSEPGEASYRVDAYSADIERLTLFRADPEDRCTTLTLSSSHDVPLYPIEVPEGWKVDVGSNGFTCAEAYNFPSLRHAIGGEGHVEFSTPDRCAIDFDVTLFFYLGTGTEIQATRFVGRGVPVPNLGGSCEGA